tara:strand:+ start:8677 stop:9546 length:870 start_codon:yes stop_codon:yes gene_type:complete
MKEFIWRVAGADCKILNISGADSQRSFTLIGGLFLLIYAIIFLAFFNLFYGIFDVFLLSFFTTIVFGFLISNIYRLNLISLEPATLPREESVGSMLLSYSVRYIIVAAFAFFVSKCFEMVLVLFLEYEGLVDYNGSEGYMEHLVKSNQDHPWLWLITVVIVILFLTPVYLRHRLNRAHEYYSIKQTRDIRIVLDQYKMYRQEYNSVMTMQYNRYGQLSADYIQNGTSFDPTKNKLPKNDLASPVKGKKIVPDADDKYEDPPFNTKLNLDKVSSKKSYEEFIALFMESNE